MLFLALVNIYPSLGKYSQGIVYILSLLSVFFFAYKSNVLMKFAIKMFKTRLFKHYLYSITSIQLTRMYTYIIMVVVYILYNFFNLSNINLPFIPFETLNVIKEVFITFVAIDSLIQTSKYIKKEN